MKHENGIRVKHLNIAITLAVLSFSCAGVHGQGYPDGRPAATLRIDAKDQGVALRHGDGPGKCDYLGAREAQIFEEKGVYHLFYDGAGPKGWLACLATSKDLKTWEKKGPILDFGTPGESASAAACSPWVYFDGKEWHMFYLGTPNVSGPPDLVPSFPYLTLKAKGKSLAGPWIKQPDVTFPLVGGTTVVMGLLMSLIFFTDVSGGEAIILGIMITIMIVFGVGMWYFGKKSEIRSAEQYAERGSEA